MKKILFILLMACGIAHGQSVTNYVGGKVIVYKSDSVILKQWVPATTSLDPVVIGQVYTNGVSQADIYWGTVMTPAIAGAACDTLFIAYSGGTTNTYSAGYYSIAVLGVAQTVKDSGTAPVPPGWLYKWIAVTSSGTHYVTNAVKVIK